MKVLLISLHKNTNAISLNYIHSNLRFNKINSHILFLPQFNFKDRRPLEEFIENLDPKIIGLSLMSHEFDKAKTVTSLIKKSFPHIILAWGGIHPIIDPEACLDYADYVFTGEAEHSFLEFVNAIRDGKSINHIQNLAHVHSNKTVINQLRPYNEDLDSLPFPEFLPVESYILRKRKVVKLNRKLLCKYSRFSGKSYYLMTTRGCPLACTYCCNSFFNERFGKQGIRKRSVENVIEELKNVLKLFPDLIYIHVVDDCFTVYDTRWLSAFADMYSKEINKHLICLSIPSYLTEEKVRILKKAGLSWMFLGLQSGSEQIMKNIFKRSVSTEKFTQAAQLLKRFDIASYIDIILDNPYETEEDLYKTIEVLTKVPKPVMLNIFSLTFYRGTELYEKAQRENLTIESYHSKNFHLYTQTTLNKIVRLTVLFPKSFIMLLHKHHKSLVGKIIVSMMYVFGLLFLEPINSLRLIYISMHRNPFLSLKMAPFFLKTGFYKIILRQ